MQFLVSQIDQIIMFCAGIWVTAAGFGYDRSNGRQGSLAQLIPHFRWMGPLLMVISLVLAFAKASGL